MSLVSCLNCDTHWQADVHKCAYIHMQAHHINYVYMNIYMNIHVTNIPETNIYGASSMGSIAL